MGAWACLRMPFAQPRHRQALGWRWGPMGPVVGSPSSVRPGPLDSDWGDAKLPMRKRAVPPYPWWVEIHDVATQ